MFTGAGNVAVHPRANHHARDKSDRSQSRTTCGDDSKRGAYSAGVNRPGAREGVVRGMLEASSTTLSSFDENDRRRSSPFAHTYFRSRQGQVLR